WWTGRTLLCRGGGLVGLLRLRGGLAAFGRLSAESFREPLHAPFRINQLLPPGEERVAVVADFEVELRFGRPGLPGGAARTARLDFVVLRMNPLLHCRLLALPGKRSL